MTITDLFDLEGLDHPALFADVRYPWEWLTRLKAYLESIPHAIYGDVSAGSHLEGGPIFIGENAHIEPGVFIKGPAYIGAGAEVRHGAYIRPVSFIGERAVVGHATEVKGSILLPTAQAPHFNYVGDSILGRRANLGAGSILANVRADLDPKRTIKVRWGDELIDTGLRKLGGILGDGAMVGCNTVINPGTIMGRGALAYGNISLSGTVPGQHIVKNVQQHTIRPRRS